MGKDWGQDGAGGAGSRAPQPPGFSADPREHYAASSWAVLQYSKVTVLIFRYSFRAASPASTSTAHLVTPWPQQLCTPSEPTAPLQQPHGVSSDLVQVVDNREACGEQVLLKLGRSPAVSEIEESSPTLGSHFWKLPPLLLSPLQEGQSHEPTGSSGRSLPRCDQMCQPIGSPH